MSDDYPDRTPEKFQEPAFQDTMLAALWKDSGLGSKWASRLRPEYCCDDLREACLSSLTLFYADRGRAPTRHELIANMSGMTGRKVVPEGKKLMRKSISKYVNSLRRAELPPSDDARDDLIDWSTVVSYGEAMENANAAFKRGDMDDIWISLRQAQANLHFSENNPVTDFFKGWKKMYEERRASDPHGAVTGVPKLDKRISFGTLPRGCLLTLIGAAKFGKTTSLLNFAAANALAGKRAMLVTLEIRKHELSMRIISRFTRLRTQILPKKGKLIKLRMKKMRKLCRHCNNNALLRLQLALYWAPLLIRL